MTRKRVGLIVGATEKAKTGESHKRIVWPAQKGTGTLPPEGRTSKGQVPAEEGCLIWWRRMRGFPSDKVCVLSSLMQGHQQRAEDESRGGSENGVIMLSAHEKFAVMISSEKAQLRIFLQSVQFAPAQTQRRQS